MSRKLILLLCLALLAVTPVFVKAQALTVTTSEPRDVDNAVGSTLSITGTSFTPFTTVRLIGYGYLTVTFINSTALTAAIPAGVPGGIYDVEVNDAANGLAISPVKLIVVQQTTPIPIPTPVPTQPLIGQPSLIVRNFSVAPNAIQPGGQVRATIEVVNDGNQPAFGVSVAVDAGGKFVPVGGAAVSLPDLFPGNSFFATINATAAADAVNGANLVGLTMTFRDSEGKQYTTKATISVNVDAGAASPLITLLTYDVTPDVVLPGEIAVISAQIQNTGDKTANQVLVRVAGTSPVLIAGPRGDAFPVGDIEANQTKIVELPLYVAQDAKSGIQAQGLTLSYVMDGKVVETPVALAVDVAVVEKPRPIILLNSAQLSSGEIKPGDQFNLSFSLKNVGNGDATNMLVTFGTVESSGGDGGASGTPSSDSSTTTKPSANFAPLGTGATQFLSVLGVNQEISLSQEFIASASLDSGIYGLPITTRYNKEDGSVATDSFSATVVVVGLPKLQVTFDSPLPPQATVFDTIPLAITVTNRGKNAIMIDRIEVTGAGIDIYDGGSTPVGQLKTDEQVSINTTISPNTEGIFTVTLNVFYIDDLNRPQVFPLSYTAEALPLPPTPDFTPEPTPDFNVTPEPTPVPVEEDIISKLLLGFLGLGE
jgi:hypothetical protein